jgi:parallel beta-helix repeat protein
MGAIQILMPDATGKKDKSMTTYYVSSQIGDDDNAGTSAAAPFATLQVAADHTAPGDTVLVMNGTYTSGDPVLNITIGGTASAPITFAAAPGQTPVIDSSGNWNAIDVRAPYIVISGFTVVGNAASISLQQALADASPDTPFYNGNGIAVHAGHVIIQNNTVHDEPGGGIYTQGADYVQILNNIVYNNAHWSVYGNSGISVAASVNADTAPGPHIIISGNLVYGNSELVPEYRAGAVTDGEGIILDSNSGYRGGFLVQNNTVHDNGGPGIEAFLSDNAVISLNILYGNNTQNVQAPSASQIFINQSNDVTITNNSMGDPALVTYQNMYGAPPSSTELSILGEFVAAQSSYGQLIGVQDPTVYVYEALGAALASGSDTGSKAFANTWGPLAIASDTTFTTQAYASVFATPGTSAQIQHFIDQIDFFKSLYTASGAYGTDANQIDLLARGAIYGQMLGVKAEFTDVALVGVSSQHDITT